MGLFSGHRLIKESDGYVLLLNLDFSTEFSGPLGSPSEGEETKLRAHVEEYITRNYPNLKIKAARIVVGSLIVASFTFSPIKTAQAATVTDASGSYTVQQGDSLFKIANNFNVTIDQLVATNSLTSDQIYVGQSLKIPDLTLPDGIYRTGSSGDQVRGVQRVLASLGYRLKVDGIYGSQTAGIISQIQKKNPPMKTDGIYGPQTKAYLQNLIDNKFTLVANPNDTLVLVNRMNGLPGDYIPPDLVVPNVPFTTQEFVPQKLMRKEAALALEQLFAKAAQDKVSLLAVSGYRSYDRQAEIFARNIQISPDEIQFSARPGESEHQTGLAIDVSGLTNSYQLSQSYADTPEGQWLKQNAPEFGFIIRYPMGKENITGYQYEPWHIRYVGKNVAPVISQQGLALEEYLGNK
jgi:LAS superfamily LD-carboxypeptidase LdcB